MRNLKKVLALGLALIMMLSMMSFASAAEAEKMIAGDFKDWDKVENKDAVSLAVDLDIIRGRDSYDVNGKKDGYQFDPEHTIRRCEWAKMVYVALNGSDDGGVLVDATENIYPDVKGSHWAAGYIEWLKADSIMAGDGNGNFNPDAPIRVAEAAKTLLVGLGYDTTRQGYTGASWSTNIMRDARKNGIVNDVAQSALQNLTRDNAAQMVYNTLQAHVVEKIEDRDMGEWYVKGYEKGETLAYEVFSIVPVTVKINAVADGKATLTVVEDEDAPTLVAGTVFGTPSIPATVDQKGQTAVVFCKAAYKYDPNGNIKTITLKSIVSSSLASGSISALYAAYGGVDYDKAFAAITEDGKANPDYIASLNKSVSYFLNGADSDEAGTKTAAKLAGNYVQLVDNDDDGAIDVIKVTTYSVAKADKKAAVSEDGKTVTVAGVIDEATAIANVKGYETVAAGDVCMLSKNGDVITIEVLKPATTGKVTLKDQSNKITVNGTAYGATKLTACGSNVDLASFDVVAKAKVEYKLFLDKAGNLIYMDEVKAADEGEDTTSELAIVLRAGGTQTGAVTDEWGNTTPASVTAKAQLVYLKDASSEIVTVAKYNNEAIEDLDTWQATGANTLVKVSANSKGGYDLKAVDTTSIGTGDISAKPTFTTGQVANANTRFLLQITGGKDDVTKYTHSVCVGFAKLPSLKTMSGWKVTVEKTDYVFLTGAGEAAEETVKELVYVADFTTYTLDASGNANITAYNEAGKAVSLALAVGEDGKWAGLDGDSRAPGFFELKTKNDKGAITLVEKVADADFVKITASGVGGVIVIGEKAVMYDKDTVVILVDGTGSDIKVSTTTAEFTMKDDVTYKAYTATATDKLADVIWVVAYTEA